MTPGTHQAGEENRREAECAGEWNVTPVTTLLRWTSYCHAFYTHHAQ